MDNEVDSLKEKVKELEKEIKEMRAADRKTFDEYTKLNEKYNTLRGKHMDLLLKNKTTLGRKRTNGVSDEKVMELHRANMSLRKIATATGLNLNTVKKIVDAHKII